MLEPFEISVIKKVFQDAGGGREATSHQIEEWARKIVGSQSNFLSFIESWGPTLREWFEQQYFMLDDPASERAKVVFIGMTIAVLFLAFLVGYGGSQLAAVPIGAALIVLSLKTLSRRTLQAALEIKRWEAFRHFMTDFSAMKEAAPGLLTL